MRPPRKRKNSTKRSTAKFKSEFGSFAARLHTARIRPWPFLRSKCPCIWREKTDKEKSHKGIWRSDAPEASQVQTRDVPGTPGTFGPDLCVINAKGTECPRDSRDISRDRWDVSPGQTGRTPGGVPPKFFMFIGFFFPKCIGDLQQGSVQDHGKGGLSLRGVAATTETATT